MFKQLSSFAFVSKPAPITSVITRDDYETGEGSGVNKTTIEHQRDFIEISDTESEDDFQECQATILQSSIPGRKVTRSTSIEIPPSPRKVDKRKKKTISAKKGG